MEETPRNPWLSHRARSADDSVGILLIDPNPEEAEILARALEAAGHRILPAPNLEAALSLASASPVGAVVLDLADATGTLDFSSIDTLRRDARTASAPILAVTRQASTAERVEALRRGADDVLAKPCDDEELVLRVERRLVTTEASRQPAIGPALRHALTLGTLPTPVMVGRYLAKEVIGRGAMGVVIRSEDPRLQRPVAVKVLGRSTINAKDWADVAELEHEGAALAHFDHPHIVKVFDAGLTDGLPFLVMELVEGECLSARLEEGPLKPAEAVMIGVAVAEALVEAHENGWVHRDIKPANILLGLDGSIKVTDFGLAGLVDDAKEGERVFGTPGYAPPECLVGEAHTPLGDLFALGAVLYRSLTGRAAFAGDSVSERLATTLTGKHLPLENCVPGLPRPLYQLVESLLAPLPSARPATARLVARRLEWLGQAMSYAPLPNEEAESAETLPICSDLVH